MMSNEPNIEPEKIRLNVLICDGSNAAVVLRQALEQEDSIRQVRLATNVVAVEQAVGSPEINTIIIDPLAQSLEEKGAALAFGKPLVLMIEEGVTEFGGLQGDWQRIHFGGKGFLKAALEAVEQLKSWAG